MLEQCLCQGNQKLFQHKDTHLQMKKKQGSYSCGVNKIKTICDLLGEQHLHLVGLRTYLKDYWLAFYWDLGFCEVTYI